MTYVEWLRVRNILRVTAIIMGIFIAIALGLRLYFNKEVTQDTAFINHVQMQPGSTVAHATLPDGTTRTTIHDPKDNTTVVIDNHGAYGRHIEITEPYKHADTHDGHVMMGSISVNQARRGDMRVTTIDTDSRTPFIFYMIAADVVGLLIATLLAAPFARESDGHLEYALTKPASRELLGIRTIGVDVAGIVLAEALTVAAVIICQAMFELPQFDFRGVSINAILMGIAAPCAWYALIAAATASMKRGYGAVVGFAWPVALALGGLTLWSGYWTGSLLGAAIHNALWVINHASPLTYMSFSVTENHATGELIAPANFGVRLTIELALFVIYSALAVFQWKRVEA